MGRAETSTQQVKERTCSPKKKNRKWSQEVEPVPLLSNDGNFKTSKSLKLSNQEEIKDHQKPPKVPKHLRSDKTPGLKPKSPNQSYFAQQRQTIDKYVIVNKPREDIKRDNRTVLNRVIKKEDPNRELLAMKHIYSVLFPSNQQERHSLQEKIDSIKELKYPNLVKIIDFIQDPQKKCYHIVMENMEGGSLESLISKKGKPQKLKMIVAQQYFRSLIFGLSHCHFQQPSIVHGNIKPSNLLLTVNQNELKVSDCGIISLVEKTSTEIVTNIETNYFMAPELISAAISDYTTATDIWACGITLFFMVTGNYPFMASSLPQLFQSILTQEPVYPQEMNLLLKNLLIRMLCKNPAQRININEIQSHDWFTSNGVLSPPPLLRSDASN